MKAPVLQLQIARVRGPNCDRVNFSGTRCLSCGVDGGGFSR